MYPNSSGLPPSRASALPATASYQNRSPRLFLLVVLAVFLMFWFVLATTPDEKKIKRQKKLDERAAYAANIDARFKKNPNSHSRENEPPLF